MDCMGQQIIATAGGPAQKVSSGAGSGLSTSFRYLSIINFNLQTTKDGCIVPTISFCYLVLVHDRVFLCRFLFERWSSSRLCMESSSLSGERKEKKDCFQAPCLSAC